MNYTDQDYQELAQKRKVDYSYFLVSAEGLSIFNLTNQVNGYIRDHSTGWDFAIIPDTEFIEPAPQQPRKVRTVHVRVAREHTSVRQAILWAELNGWQVTCPSDYEISLNDDTFNWAVKLKGVKPNRA